jgi:RHS repeat-associated protein
MLLNAASNLMNQFTFKERDAETGLDYFEARYYSGAQGRFTAVDPSMESAVLQNPQSWNRYSYTINNPLRYIDPTGELWISSGDAQNPYSWVDKCKNDQTCYESRAAAVGDTVVIYGSENAKDITTIAENPNGYIALTAVSNQHDAFFDVKNDNKAFMSPQNAAALFNTFADYKAQYSKDSEFMVIEAGLSNGADFDPHASHDHGRSADVRYKNDKGVNLQGDKVVFGADKARMSTLVDAAEANGFSQIFSGRPKDFGTAYAKGHGSHIHFGTPEQKITPPKK